MVNIDGFACLWNTQCTRIWLRCWQHKIMVVLQDSEIFSCLFAPCFPTILLREIIMEHNSFYLEKQKNLFRVHSMRSFNPHVGEDSEPAMKTIKTQLELRCHIMRLWCNIARIAKIIFRPDAERAKPVRVYFIRLFIPHDGSFHSPTWRFQRHNSTPSCDVC